MLESQKGWQSLDSQRPDQRLVLFYKIVNGLASVETGEINCFGSIHSIANVCVYTLLNIAINLADSIPVAHI